jgi:N-acyl-D-amino-acid deacylase
VLDVLITGGEVYDGTGAHPVRADAALDLIASGRSRVGTAFFSMSEDNLRKALARPWVAISSDGASMAPEGAFLLAPTHPRAYGSFARVLGHYVRDEKLRGGVRRSRPARNAAGSGRSSRRGQGARETRPGP